MNTSKNYLFKLTILVVLWFSLFFGFIFLVNPYGVSPFSISIKHFNEFKPKRRDIDRTMKPYEVYKYQPKTIFMGSSRIHESINPLNFEGTKFAPAYNAAIPANFLTMNTAQLRQYIRLNKNLKYVFIELFFWDFIFGQPSEPKLGFYDFAMNSYNLFFSKTAFTDSIHTIFYNYLNINPPIYVHEKGFWMYQSGHNPEGLFNLYTKSIVNVHKKIPQIDLQIDAFKTINDMVKLCEENNIEIYFIITPNYPYDDYRILSYGYWPLLEEWHRNVAKLPNVVSFSIYNKYLTESVSSKMIYWSDPLHASLLFGDLMIKSILDGNINSNDTMSIINKSTVESVLNNRFIALNNWINNNSVFVNNFENTKLLDKP